MCVRVKPIQYLTTWQAEREKIRETVTVPMQYVSVSIQLNGYIQTFKESCPQSCSSK